MRGRKESADVLPATEMEAARLTRYRDPRQWEEHSTDDSAEHPVGWDTREGY